VAILVMESIAPILMNVQAAQPTTVVSTPTAQILLALTIAIALKGIMGLALFVLTSTNVPALLPTTAPCMQTVPIRTVLITATVLLDLMEQASRALTSMNA
jgi:hypothetical protein